VAATSEEMTDLLRKLVDLQTKQQPATTMPGMMPMGMQGMQQPFAHPFPMAPMTGAQQLQPGAVLVPITVQLPDGRETSLYLQFGGEHLQQLPTFLQGLLMQFGNVLKAYPPRGYQNGFGGNGNGYRGGYGGRRRY
jgi:hypothetical protein